MRKLRLNIDELSVESFEIARDQKERGTVRGEQQTSFTCQYETCLNPTCVDVNCPTMRPTEQHYASCFETCQTCQGETCYFSCEYSGCQETPCMVCTA